jgi:multicomponent Na+:H+ antiporter subunit E
LVFIANPCHAYIGGFDFQSVMLPIMKHWLTFCLALISSWLLWSGHFDNLFILAIGALSVMICMWICARMGIVDKETDPAELGVLRFLGYLVWLTKEIVKSNIEVTRIILDPELKLQRNLVELEPKLDSELGRVFLANSITLTPGTIAVSMDKYLVPDTEAGELVEKHRILVHALSFEGAEEDLAGDMERRVKNMEGQD